jgi:hypothetical protein
MSAAKRPPLPLILLANHFLDGEVVFWTGSAWSRNPVDALVAQSDDEAAQLEAIVAREAKGSQVVDAALVDVRLDDKSTPRPNHFRERFKVSGPSVRLDLGKQAEFAQADIAKA